MENWGYIRLFKLSRQAFFPKSASECRSQQRVAMFDYADEDMEDSVLSIAGLTPLTCSVERRGCAPFVLKHLINH